MEQAGRRREYLLLVQRECFQEGAHWLVEVA